MKSLIIHNLVAVVVSLSLCVCVSLSLCVVLSLCLSLSVCVCFFLCVCAPSSFFFCVCVSVSLCVCVGGLSNSFQYQQHCEKSILHKASSRSLLRLVSCMSLHNPSISEEKNCATKSIESVATIHEILHFRGTLPRICNNPWMVAE
jgi:hypothetical protein